MTTPSELAARLSSGTSARTARSSANLNARQQRLQQSLVQSLADVLPRDREQRTLKPEPARGAIPAARGTARQDYQPGKATGGGGIASPLQEQDFSAREWWPLGIPSTDGLLYFPAEKKVTMTDANGAQVVLEYAEP